MSSQENGSAVDKAKAKAIEWLIEPSNAKQRHTFARINSTAPYAIASFLNIMDFIEQILSADIDESDVRKFTIDDTLRSADCHEFINTLLETSASVTGERAQQVSDMVTKMNHKHSGMPFLGNLLGQASDEEQIDYDEMDESDENEDN